ncbi:hypothetical protein BKA70DRAFT_1443198 [Coprinopsis sp. MPI-PUGE-AT-0042]|nr:hypothetical protein BKA70DRAFT_1443198 [Coprinopsis sp. MPI-PUGE-AT-0042]
MSESGSIPKAFVAEWAPPSALRHLSCDGWAVTQASPGLHFHTDSGGFTLVSFQQRPIIPRRPSSHSVLTPGLAEPTTTFPLINSSTPHADTHTASHSLIQYQRVAIAQRNGRITNIVHYGHSSIVFKFVLASPTIPGRYVAAPFALLQVPLEYCDLTWIERLLRAFNLLWCLNPMHLLSDASAQEEGAIRRTEWIVREIRPPASARLRN